MKKLSYTFVIVVMIMFFGLNNLVLSISADCGRNSYLKNTEIDTIDNGIVKVTKYYEITETNEIDTIVDTISESELLDSLIKDYTVHRHAIIGYIDSVLTILPEEPIFPQPLNESLYIAIDTSFKESFEEKYIFIKYSGLCKESAENIKNEKFIAFFNEYDAIEKMGVYPPIYLEGESGYFIENNKITKKGDYYGLPGISVDLEYFFETVDLKIINTLNQSNSLKLNIEVFHKGSLYSIIFPNPYKRANIKFFNLSGRTIKEIKNIKTTRYTCDARIITCGLYLVKIDNVSRTYYKIFPLVK